MSVVLLLPLAALIGYCYGVLVGGRGGYRKGYERGQDDTVARLIV